MALRSWKDKPFWQSHRMLHVAVSHAEWEYINQECQRRGMTVAEWLRHMLAVARSERLSVAEDYVRTVIPEQVAQRGEAACAVMGEAKRHEASLCRLPDERDRRRQLLQEAGQWFDSAAWFKIPLDRYAAQTSRAVAAPATTPAPGPPTAGGPSTSG